MQSSDHPEIDWTGVQPDQSPIEPLDDNSAAVRLRLLSERAKSLTVLRNAFVQQQSNGEQLSRSSEPTARPSR
jgi:hypothetical protein